MKLKNQVMLGTLLLSIGVSSSARIVNANELPTNDNNPKMAKLLADLALDYEQELDDQILPHKNNTLEEGKKFAAIMPADDSFLGDDQLNDWQTYCTELGLSVTDYKDTLQKETKLRQTINSNLKAAQSEKDVFTTYHDVNRVIGAVLDYIDNKKTLLHRLSDQLLTPQARQHGDGLYHLGRTMLSNQAKEAYQNNDVGYAGTTLSSRHQYQLAALLDAEKHDDTTNKAADNHDSDHHDNNIDVRPSVPTEDNSKANDQQKVPARDHAQIVPQPVDNQTTQKMEQQQLRINSLQDKVVNLNQQIADLQATIKKIQNDGFGPIVYDKTGLISKTERTALDQLMDVIEQNASGKSVPKKHHLVKRKSIKQRLKKVRLQLKRKHLSHRKKAKLLKLKRQLLKQLRHK